MPRSRNAPAFCRPSLAPLLLAALITLATAGCATTTYTVDEEPPVSEARAKRDLGIDYLSTRRTAMAIRELQDSLELDPGDPQTHLWLGEAFRRKGQTARAEQYLRDAVTLAGERADHRAEQEARLNLSALLSQMGHYEDSLEYCTPLAEDPTNSTPWRALSNCGWALMKLGRVQEARSQFQRALDFHPRFAPALLNLGILEAGQGHRLAAITALGRAIESGRLSASGHAEANYRLGEIYVALGRRDKALAHFREAAKVAPEDDWGSQSQAYLDLLR